MRPHGSPVLLQRRRLRAAAMSDGGVPAGRIAARLGVTRRSVERWIAAYQAAGRRALEAKPVPGRPLKLAAADRERLAGILARGARAHGFGTWTCSTVRAVIRREMGVRYSRSHVVRLLASLGLAGVLGRRTGRPRQRDAHQRGENA